MGAAILGDRFRALHPAVFRDGKQDLRYGSRYLVAYAGRGLDHKPSRLAAHCDFFQHSSVPWTAYSWGFDLLVSWARRTFGLPGIPGLLICIEILIALTLLLCVRRIAGSFWPAWLIGAAVICASYVNPLRPALLTVFFFTLELFLIFESERTEDDRFLYWIALVFVAWANCHIQFIYGIAVVGLYVAARISSHFQIPGGGSKPRGAVGTLTGIFALSLAASCLGPNGFLPYRVALQLSGQTFVYQIIAEMHAMTFRGLQDYLVLLFAMAGCFAAGKSKRRGLFRPALLALTAVVSFRLGRDMWFVSIASAFVIAEAVRDYMSSRKTQESGASWSAWEPTSYAIATALAVALAFTFAIHKGISTGVMISEIDRVYPIGATEFIRDSHLQGPMFNSFNWGGFLIFNLPEYPVSMDSRTDVYGDDGVRLSVATTDALPGWKNNPDLAKANFVIIERYFALASALAHDTDYTLAYQDQIAMVYVKKHPTP